MLVSFFYFKSLSENKLDNSIFMLIHEWYQVKLKIDSKQSNIKKPLIALWKARQVISKLVIIQMLNLKIKPLSISVQLRIQVWLGPQVEERNKSTKLEHHNPISSLMAPKHSVVNFSFLNLAEGSTVLVQLVLYQISLLFPTIMKEKRKKKILLQLIVLDRTEPSHGYTTNSSEHPLVSIPRFKKMTSLEKP